MLSFQEIERKNEWDTYQPYLLWKVRALELRMYCNPLCVMCGNFLFDCLNAGKLSDITILYIHHLERLRSVTPINMVLKDESQFANW